MHDKNAQETKAAVKNILNTKYKFVQEPRRVRVTVYSACENAKIGKFKNSK